MDAAIDAAQAAGTAVERVLISEQRDRRRPALARGRRALRARPSRPRVLPRRPRRRQARHARGGQALPGDPRLLRQRPHAAGRDGRPRERPRGGRHRGHDRLRGAPRRRLGGRHRDLLERLNDPSFTGNGRRPRGARARPPRPTPRPPARSTTSTTTGRSTSARAARTPRSSGSCTASSPRPSSAAPPTSTSSPATRTCASATASTACCRRRRSIPASIVPAVISRVKILSDLDIAERRIPQDGRISMEIAERHDRPPRRDAAGRLRRERRHAHPRPELGDDPARAAGDAAAGARALHQGLRPGARRGARHRPDRLRQVDVALRRAQPAQHDREEHHHDRGPGRVPARRRSPRCRSTTRRA